MKGEKDFFGIRKNEYRLGKDRLLYLFNESMVSEPLRGISCTFSLGAWHSDSRMTVIPVLLLREVAYMKPGVSDHLVGMIRI
jgi:hypothetical protein